MQMNIKHTRLFWLALLLLGALVVSCAGAPAELPAAPAADADTAAVDTDGNEAPELAALVETGELPPLVERLPLNPKVVMPHEELGRYGGTWRMGLRGGEDDALLYRTIGYEQLMRWNLDWTEIEPNIAESVDVNENATEYTVHLREGIKWSDGEPLTTDDVMWWYEYVLSDPEVTLTLPNFLVSDVDGESQLATFEQVGDYTFTVTFAQPSGIFLAQLAAPEGQAMKPRPTHWLQQFHPDFAADADALTSMAEEQGFATWQELLADRADVESYSRFAEQPTLHAWQITTDYGAAATQVIAKRNPYYWKVDPEGRQLPYIDEVIYQIGDDVNVLVLQAMNGEIDNQGRHIAANDNKAVFFDNREAGKLSHRRSILGGQQLDGAQPQSRT